jgi:hypothetical protein
MTSTLFMDISKVAHGSFNTLLVIVFLYQAWIGLAIRRGRKSGKNQFAAMKRHRKLGPFLVVMGFAGYCAGLILVYIDSGLILEYPLHLMIGSIIVFLLICQYVVSRKIRGPESPWRTPHLAIGVGILCFYIVQIVTGLGVMF